MLSVSLRRRFPRVRVALRLAALEATRKGRMSRKDYGQFVSLMDSSRMAPDGSSFSDYLCTLTLNHMDDVSGGRITEGLMAILDWMRDNWDWIVKVIQFIIPLFA